MRQRKIPLRKCVVTNEMKPKKDMIRIVKNKVGEVSIDPSGKMNGRGAYVSLSEDAVKMAHEKKVLDQVLDTTLDDDFYEELLSYVRHRIARMSL